MLPSFGAGSGFCVAVGQTCGLLVHGTFHIESSGVKIARDLRGEASSRALRGGREE